ncbi:hypothetical protein [Tolypothrix sp. NIES-4075]|nr:hypothetical protein [Tolypothrix sp. NIES-4075]
MPDASRGALPPTALALQRSASPMPNAIGPHFQVKMQKGNRRSPVCD